jgi:hypothetical protein
VELGAPHVAEPVVLAVREQLPPGPSPEQAQLRIALTLGYAGRTAEARAILERYEREDPGPGADPGRCGAMAMAWITTGDLDRAFAHLDRLLAARWYPGWLNCPLFDPIRRDPRWPALAERMAREFSREAMGPLAREQWIQAWPRPAGGAASGPPTG